MSVTVSFIMIFPHTPFFARVMKAIGESGFMMFVLIVMLPHTTMKVFLLLFGNVLQSVMVRSVPENTYSEFTPSRYSRVR